MDIEKQTHIVLVVHDNPFCVDPIAEAKHIAHRTDLPVKMEWRGATYIVNRPEYAVTMNGEPFNHMELRGL